jgi:hypothetical protein
LFVQQSDRPSAENVFTPGLDNMTSAERRLTSGGCSRVGLPEVRAAYWLHHQQPQRGGQP